MWAVLGLTTVGIAQFFMRRLPVGLIPFFVVGPLGGILGGWIGTRFNLEDARANGLCKLALVVGGAILL
jgi:uncharacterized membrane protein YeaQ/YmgE (transglycosylase-associated protein family)